MKLIHSYKTKVVFNLRHDINLKIDKYKIKLHMYVHINYKSMPMII